MEVVTDPRSLSALARSWQMIGQSVGIVPTMGALHDGHRSLIDSARSSCDRVVTSVFVNPTQFDDPNDFENYPSTMEQDLALCESLGVDVVYAPNAITMYPFGHSTSIHVRHLTDAWEGRDRPGHFDGVATVVTKLLVASRADRAFFGQKDFQQCAVITRLVEDLDLSVDVIVCPTVRESDGLALSSRNVRLSDGARLRATAIHRSLRGIQAQFAAGQVSSAQLVAAARAVLKASGLEVHYLDVVDPADLTPVSTSRTGDVVIVAASCDGVRLLDNHILT